LVSRKKKAINSLISEGGTSLGRIPPLAFGLSMPPQVLIYQLPTGDTASSIGLQKAKATMELLVVVVIRTRDNNPKEPRFFWNIPKMKL